MKRKVDARLIEKLSESDSEFENHQLRWRELRGKRYYEAVYWKAAYYIYTEDYDMSIYYSLLGKLASKYKVGRWFVEAIICRAFSFVMEVFNEAKNIVLINIDRLLGLKYKELEKAVRRWYKDRQGFENFWERRMLYAGINTEE
jgi:hypothetical protein